MKILKGRFRLGLRLKYTVVPIDIDDLAAILPKYGYQVSPPPVLPVGTGITLEIPPGPIAQLGDSTIDADMRRGIIGLNASSVQEVVSGFRQLVSIMQTELNVNIDDHTWFVEFACDLNIRGNDRAIDALRNVKTNVAEVTAKAFGEPMGIFSLRLGSKEHDPSGPDWFDLRIEPLLRNPQVYFVAIVYRNSNVNRVLKTAELTEDNIGTIIDSLEKEKKRNSPSKPLPPTTAKPAAPKKSNSKQ